MNNDIYVIYGNKPKEMIEEVLKKFKIEEEIDYNDLIGIKPNLVVAKNSNLGATTDPELVAGLIEYLQEKGYQNIVIMEGAWVGARTKRAFKICGYQEISKKYGVPLIDLQQDDYQTIKIDGLDINVCNQALAVDYLINMPVLKGHCQTRITCALKNLKGCIPDSEKRRFHSLGLHRPIACLNKALKQDFVIIDGIIGDLDFEEGGNPVQMNRVIVGKDPVLIDSYAAELLGYYIDEIPYIKMAEELGVGLSDLASASIKELNKDQGVEVNKTPRKVKRLVRNVEESKACSACFGNLVHALKRMDEEGRLNNISEKIYIGQGYKDKQLKGIGIGICTNGADRNIAGCPPKTRDIIDELEKII